MVYIIVCLSIGFRRRRRLCIRISFVLLLLFVEILFKSEITGIKVIQIFGKAAVECTLCTLEYFFMGGIYNKPIQYSLV